MVEMRAFVDGLTDAKATKEALRNAKESGKARHLMERLEDFTKDLPLDHVPPLVRVLFDEGDGLRFESRGLLDVTADMEVARITYQSLSRLSTEGERHQLLLECVKAGTGLYTVVQEVSLSKPDERSAESRLISDEALWQQLRDAAVERVRAAHSSGVLWGIPRLPYVLFRWMEWAGEAETKAAVTGYVADDANLLAFVTAFVDHARSHMMGDKVGRTQERISKKGIGVFIKLDDLAARLRAIGGQAGESADVANRLLGMLEKKPDDPWDE